MKGILFSVKKSNVGLKRKDLVYFRHKYGINLLLVTAIFIGIVFGAICAGNADKSLVDGLDIIFTSDFELRCNQTVLSSFMAGLTANFIFFTAIFLLGLSAWGSIGVPAVIAFKGFGMGLTGGYLYKCYSLTGVGFFLLVMLLGCVASTLALIFQGKLAIGFANSLFARVRGVSPDEAETFYRYIINSSFILIALSISAMADAILNFLFAGIFTFL